MGERPRALLTVLIVAGAFAVAAVVTVVLLLHRSQGPTAEPSPTSTMASPMATVTPSATPSPSPTVAVTASEIAMRASGFTVVGDDGSTLYSYEWTGDADEAVATLTELLDAPPIESIIEGDGTHYPAYTSYRWDGFGLRDMIEAPGGKPRAESFRPSYVEITGDAAAAVAITPEFGVRIGMTQDEVRALGPDSEFDFSEYEAMESDAFRFIFGMDRADDDPPGYTAWVTTDDGGQAVAEILYIPYSDL